MDNRRRFNSRREAERPPYAPAAPVAEIIELGPVPQPRRGGLTPAALGLAVFAAGVLAGSSLVRLVPAETAVTTTGPTAGTSGAPVRGAGSPTPGPRATPRPTASPRPTIQVTPAPTDVPWTWSKGAFDTEYGYPTGSWSIGGKLVISLATDDNMTFRTSDDGVNWTTYPSSRAIRDYQAAAIIDDRLWFALRISGLQDDHLEIGYPGWPAEDGANLQWKTQGPVAGATPDWVGALGRINGTWVMSVGTYTGEGGSVELRVSDDAVHWSTIKPAGAESVGIYQLQQLGTHLVGLGYLESSDYAPVALRTKDGRAWSTAAFPGPVGGGTSIYRMTCGTSACVAVGSISTIGVERPALWSTTDGLEWLRVATDLTDARRDGSLSMVVATPSGFIAMGAPDHDALLSRDGTTWRSLRVLPQRDTAQLSQLAVSGNLIFALGEQSVSGGVARWIGNLSTLPFP